MKHFRAKYYGSFYQNPIMNIQNNGQGIYFEIHHSHTTWFNDSKLVH